MHAVAQKIIRKKPIKHCFYPKYGIGLDILFCTHHFTILLNN